VFSGVLVRKSSSGEVLGVDSTEISSPTPHQGSCAGFAAELSKNQKRVTLSLNAPVTEEARA